MDSPQEGKQALDRARNLIRLHEHNQWVQRISSRDKAQLPAKEGEARRARRRQNRVPPLKEKRSLGPRRLKRMPQRRRRSSRHHFPIEFPCDWPPPTFRP
jgi:hypothetical protein